MATHGSPGKSAFGTIFMALVVFATACAPTTPSATAPSSGAGTVQQDVVTASRGNANTGGQAPIMAGEAGWSDKTLTIGVRDVKGFSPMNANQNMYVEDLIVGNLMLQGDDGRWAPALVDGVPQLGTDTWVLNPDGTSETIYHIKPGVKWHDGVEFTAEDVAFYFRVGNDPEIPYTQRPTGLYLEKNIEALDRYTFKITWVNWQPLADTMDLRYVWPMPQHILGPTYNSGDKVAVANHPYWTTEFVGLGPYKVVEFVPGSHLTLTAYDDYPLGPARIKNVVVRFYSDPNVLVAAVLAGAVQVTLQAQLATNDGVFLAKEWAPTGEGKVVFNYYRFNTLAVQLDPALQQPAALADVRVRRALLHAMDRKTLVAERFAGYTDVADGWASPRAPDAAFFADAITRYDFDPARAQQLLTEAGWQRGADGVLADNAGRRFELEYRATPGDDQLTQAVVSDYWKQVGIDVQQVVVPAQRLSDNEYLSNFSGIRAVQQTAQPVGAGVLPYDCKTVPSLENRWTGNNQARYCIPEMQDAFTATWVDAFPFDARLAPYKEMMRIALRDLPYLPLYFAPEVVAVRSNVSGINAIGPRDRGRVAQWAYTWTMQ